ncbi:MAG: hypothetical protein JNL11_07635 [Bdellovibrionaceae bacterium]|nr:hypothetical protein [Pseudobdellovibrionaceae bacterium]
MKKTIFVFLCVIFLIGCTAQEKSSPIIIPPGSEVQYSNAEFVQLAKEFYSVELKMYDRQSKKFIAIEDLTPKDRKTDLKNISYIIPKDKDSQGFYILDVQMSRLGMGFQAIVLPGVVTTPDIATTMAYELLMNYPKKEIFENSIEFVTAIENFIRKDLADVNARVQFPEDLGLNGKYRFYKNGVSSRIDFLKLVKSGNIEFNYNNQGNILGEPYPFGKKNSMPGLDTSNSTPLSREVRGAEKSEIKIRGFAMDPDNDFILYQWYKEGTYYNNKPKEFFWTPDFSDSKVDPYKVKLEISDGGPVQSYEWNLIVDNLNRKPYVTKNCVNTVKEWETYTCKISAQDFDGEAISFTVSDSAVNARIKVNGQATDDTTRKITVSNVNEITIEFTPNNEDALRRAGYIEVNVADVSGGTEVVPLNIFIEDINTAPDIVGSYSVLSVGGGQHEWDYCEKKDPDGKAPFFFKIEVRDPDNQPSAFPRSQHPDKVQVNVAGTLSDKVSRIDDPTDADNYAPGACPASTAEAMFFCYVWKPTQTEKSGTLTFTMKDNHGGISPLKIVNIVAEDRNQKPCLGVVAKTAVIDELGPTVSYKISANDSDGDLPYMTIENLSPTVMPFLKDCSSAVQPLILKENFNDTFFAGKVYRIAEGAGGGASSCTQANYNSTYSGVVTFSRTVPFGTDVVIPLGYPLQTAYPASGYRIKYTVAKEVTMGPNDKSVTVPVTATDRAATSGMLNKIKTNVPTGFIPPADLTVSHTATITNKGTATLTRTNTASVLNLPTGMMVTSDELVSSSQSSLVYVTTKRYKMAAGVASLPITLVQKKLRLNPGALTVMTGAALADAGITASNLGIISGEVGYTLAQENKTGVDLNVDNFCWNIWAEDGYKVPANSTLQFVGMAPATGLTLSNSLIVDLLGIVTVTRTNTSAPLTIAAGTVFKTANGSQYRSNANVTLGSGQATANLNVRRINHLSPLPVTSTSAVDPGALNQFVAAPPQAGMTVVNPTNLFDFGDVIFTRTDVTSALTIPANTALKTATNFEFKTTAAVTMDIGQSKAEAPVQNVSPTSIVYNTGANRLCLGFSDLNYIPKFISSLSAVTTEGTNTIDFPIEVNDNISDPDFPNDPSDRHWFTITNLGAAPTGTILFCRDPGDNPANVNSPACVPCSSPVAADYWESARCYMRFAPNIAHTVTSDITKTFSFVISANDNGMTVPSGTNVATQTLSVTVAELNDPPVPTDLAWNPLAGNTHLAPLNLGGFTEGTLNEYFIYASDPDRLANNKKIAFSLEAQVYDISTSTWVNRPSGMSVGVDTPNDDPFGTTWGSRYRGKIFWTPTDAEAKKFASPLGFVVKVKVSDASGTGVYNFAYYKVSVVNINQLPFLNAAVTLSAVADTYFTSSTIVISDKDFSSVGAPVNFQTSLSLCSPNSTINCAAPLTGWPDEVLTYDPLYMGNSAVASCRTGSNLKTQFALPYLTRSASGTVAADRISYTYRFDWCPQKSHIGNHTIFVNMSDNGDKDRNNLALPSQEVMAPITLKVVAPVYFISPGKNSAGTVVHYMKRAFAGRPYTYKTIIKNSKGNAVTYTLLTAPTGMTVNTSGVISWTPTNDQITSVDPSTWPTVQVRVRDNATGEIDTASFRVEVKNMLSPVQASPVIVDQNPLTSATSVKERVRKNFSVVASDANSDPLFYRWYLDDVLVYDASSTYEYFPGVLDGYTDPDGVNSLKPGQHKILVEVTDAYNTASFSWLVQVKNTVPSPVLAFNLLTYTTGITNLAWGPEAKVALTSGANTVNSLVFSGNYKRSNQVKNFVYNLIFQNGSFAASASTVKSMEVLQWAAGTTTERISWEPVSGTNFNILLTSQINREGPFSSLVNAARLPSSLGMTAVNAANLCNGTCPFTLYGGADSFGFRPSTTWTSGSTYVFTASNAADQILWDRDGGTSTVFQTLTGNFRVVSMATNPNTKRLYAAVRDVGSQVNRLMVFDIYPVTSGNPPTLLATLNVFDGVMADNRILDVVVVPNLNKIFALLPGTGGMAVLTDNGMSTPVNGDIQFVGVTEIGSSYSDVVGSGRKLVYNPTVELLYGISKDSNQLFSLDPATMELKVYASSISGGFDTLVTYPNDSLTLAISKTLGQVFIVK